MADDGELADVLEVLLRRLVCSKAASDLDAMADAEMSVSQFRCLVALATQDEAIPIHQLAERLNMSLATAGRAVDRLVAQNLITRREDPHDRRVRRISLSAQGQQVVSGIDKAGREALVVFVRSLRPADRSRLYAALLPIIDSSSTSQLRLEEHHA